MIGFILRSGDIYSAAPLGQSFAPRIGTDAAIRYTRLSY